MAAHELRHPMRNIAGAHNSALQYSIECFSKCLTLQHLLMWRRAVRVGRAGICDEASATQERSLRQASYRVMRRTAPAPALAVAAESAPLLHCTSCSVGNRPAGAGGASRSCHVEPPASTDSALTVRRLRAWGPLASPLSAASATSPPPAAALGGVSSMRGRGAAPALAASAAASAAAAAAMAALSDCPCGPSEGGARGGDAAARAASPAASSSPARPSAAADGGRCCRRRGKEREACECVMAT